MRTKSALKAKEPVRIRTKKISNGNESVYLDLYINGKRSYKFLNLYLIPETSPAAKRANRETMRAVEAIKAQMILDIANGKAGIKKDESSKVLLSDWMRYYYESQLKKGRKDCSEIKRTGDLLSLYEPGVMLCDVDKAFCRGFIDYITRVYKKTNGQCYSQSSTRLWCQHFTAALNYAVRDGVLESNPFNLLGADDKIKKAESDREYLNIDEIKILASTPCKCDHVKRAFLLSCFCGLRYGDINALTWSQIEEADGKARAKVMQQKTGKIIYIPLSSQALSWIPERGNSCVDEAVFKLPCLRNIERHLRIWTAAAGITKHVTFHVARHTFATMMITLGADVYTTSKLLGHASVLTTQIYAEIIDQKKEAAVNLVDSVF